MKIIKLIGKVLLCVAGVVVLLLLALPLWVGPVVKTAANAIVPKKTGTAFNLGEFGLNPYNGRLSVGDVQLFNPSGFDARMAATLGSLRVKVDPCSLVGDVIVVSDISVKDVFVSYVFANGRNNFAIIRENATGEKESQTSDATARRSETSAPPEGATAQAQPEGELSPEADDKPAKRVIIEHLKIEGVMVQLGPVSLPLPTIELNDIGKKSNGVTFKEAWDQIYGRIVECFKGLGVDLQSLVGGLNAEVMNSTLKAIESVKALSGGKLSSEEVDKHVGNVIEAVKPLTDAVSSEKLGKDAEKVIDGLKSLFGK